MRIGGFRLGWLKRRWWVLASCIIGVTAIALFASRPGPTTYTAEAVLLVRSGATENGPGNANEANRLAVTYARLIPLDINILDRVARNLNVERADVEGRVGVTNDANTSILRVTYQGPTRRLAIDGASSVAKALVGPEAASPNFNGLALSRLPTTATQSDNGLSVLPAGLVLGALLGLVLTLALERSRGRVEDDDDLERLLECPVTALEGLSPAGITALLQRWQSLANGDRKTVALVAPKEGFRSLTAEVATVFATTADSQGGGRLAAPGLVLVSGGAPGTWEVGEQVMQQADMTVLVIPQNTPIADLEAAVKIMQGFGSRPAWALYAADRVAVRARRRHANGEPVVVGVGGQEKPIAAR